MQTVTILKIAERYGRSRVAVHNWVEQGKFPNAKKIESPAGNYWEIPVDDLVGFEPPKRGRRKVKQD